MGVNVDAEELAKFVPPLKHEPVVISPFIDLGESKLGVKVTLDAYHDLHRSVVVHVLIDEDPAMTLDSVRDLARELAKQQLTAALELLSDD
jgi:hypothetical protein